MAGLLGKITEFVRSPTGQRTLRTATSKAQELAKDPRTRDKVKEVRDRIQRRGAEDGRSPRSSERREDPPGADR